MKSLFIIAAKQPAMLQLYTTLKSVRANEFAGCMLLCCATEQEEFGLYPVLLPKIPE